MTRRSFLTILGAAAPVFAQGQGSGRPVERLDVIPVGRMPGSMQFRYKELGERLKRDGNARVTYSATLRDSSGERPVEIVIQNPRMVRITEQSTPPRFVSFDGTRVLGNGGGATPAQAKLLEAILLDSPEALFQQFAHGESYQRLGGRLRLTNRPTPTASEEYIDLYRMFPRGEGARAIPNSGATKMIGFDSETGLLRMVSYPSGDGTPVLIEFEGWRTVNGEKFPGIITRRERGVEVFQIRVQGIQTGGRAAAAQF